MTWLTGITQSMDMSLSKGDGEGQGSLACCSPWGPKVSDTTELLNNSNNLLIYLCWVLVAALLDLH